MFTDLDPGAYTIELDHPTCVAWREEGVQPGSDVEARLRGNAAIRLEVTDGATGNPIEEYELLVGYPGHRVPDAFDTLRECDEPPPKEGLYPGFLPTVFDGSVGSNPILPEAFELVVRCSGYPDHHFRIEHLEPAETRQVEARLFPGARVEGQVLHSDGETAMPDVEVMLTRGDIAGIVGGGGSTTRGGRTRRIRSVKLQCKTDSAGRFHFGPLDPGTWTVRAAASDRVFVDETFELTGENDHRMCLRLPASSVVFGQVLLPEGEGQFALSLHALDGDSSLGGRPSSGRSRIIDLDQDGRFHLGPLPTGELELRVKLLMANLDGGQSTTSLGVRERVLVREGKETECIIDASGSEQVAVRLRLEVDGSLDSSMGFQVRPADPRARLRAVSSTEGEVRDGYRLLGYFQPGEWRLTLSPENRGWLWFRPDVLSLPRGDEVKIDVALRHVEGELRFLEEGSGEVLANQEIPWGASLYPTGAKNLPPLLQTDPDGRAKLRLPAGEIELRLGYRPVRLTWPPAGAEDIEVKLRRQ